MYFCYIEVTYNRTQKKHQKKFDGYLIYINCLQIKDTKTLKIYHGDNKHSLIFVVELNITPKYFF